MLRKLLRATTTTLLLAAALSAPSAAAVTCSHPASAYSSAGAPGSGPVNDPLFARQWGPVQVKAPAAWARGARGADTTIAVVDTGADQSHPDLQAKLVGGADFVDGGGDCPGPQDEEGHGTHVSGIAAAVTNNGVGVAGTAPDAKVMPVRVLDADGSGQDSWVIAGIRYAADNGAEVINLSLGGLPVVGQTPQFNEELEAAVAYAWSKGAVIVGAAGNESLPLCSYPAAARYALCVGAADRQGNPAAYSNLPNDPDGTVGVRAPGGAGSLFCEDDEDVWSTIWPGSGSDCQGSGSLAGYETLAGTSMASPSAAGVAALLSGKGLTNAQIMDCFKQTSSNRGAFDPVYGYGIVDAEAATAQCAPESTSSYVPTQQPASGDGTGSGGASTGTPTQPGSGPAPAPPGGEALSFQATIVRASRARVARRGLLKARVSANRPVSGRLIALLARKPNGGLRIGTRAFTLTQAGTRTVHIKLTRTGRRRLLKPGRRLRVKYVVPGARGYATPARARPR